MSRRYKWLIGIAAGLTVASVAIYIVARHAVENAAPYIRQQAIQYLQDRFDADVEIGELDINLPAISGWKRALTKTHGGSAGVTAREVTLRRKGRASEPPILRMGSFSFSVDLGVLEKQEKFGGKHEIRAVYVQNLEINVPPKGDRSVRSAAAGGGSGAGAAKNVVIENVFISAARLIVHPRDTTKRPLDISLHRLHLKAATLTDPLQYEASLQIPKPPGQIESTGSFGPWDKDDPGSSPLQGKYTYRYADLGIFPAIAGILSSTGEFRGELSRISAQGEASVPDFRLTSAGNPMPLKTTFEAEIDGTNGNTVLKPIHAQLGKSKFVTSGSVIKHDGDPRRTIDFDVKMADGRIEDFLKLAMKGKDTFMTGLLDLNARIKIPPLSGKVAEKLAIRGSFDVSDGHFLKSNFQDKIDELSRKGQGQPSNEQIDEVLVGMSGDFVLNGRQIDFSRIGFEVPGAVVSLAGGYDIGKEIMDFHGALRLDAKVSQTQTGVKRWLLKPVDPFFAKNGAGTFLRIQIVGPRASPSYGMDKAKRDDKGPQAKLAVPPALQVR